MDLGTPRTRSPHGQGLERRMDPTSNALQKKKKQAKEKGRQDHRNIVRAEGQTKIVEDHLHSRFGKREGYNDLERNRCVDFDINELIRNNEYIHRRVKSTISRATAFFSSRSLHLFEDIFFLF